MKVDLNYNYNRLNLFPVPLHMINVNGFEKVRNKLIEYAYISKKNNPKGSNFSNIGGWQSDQVYLENKDDLLESLIFNTLSQLSGIKKSVNFIVTSWFNINNHNSYNKKHCHPNADLSGVLYIKCPNNCGNIVFESPSNFQTYKEVESYTEEFLDENKYNHQYSFPPMEGGILIFPAHLMHEVERNESYEDRISVSFNIQLK
tara:strand:- start:122 stop:727 length:606 start_codon:yes stop_codon:yes gene_type:complete